MRRVQLVGLVVVACVALASGGCRSTGSGGCPGAADCSNRVCPYRNNPLGFLCKPIEPKMRTARGDCVLMDLPGASNRMDTMNRATLSQPFDFLLQPLSQCPAECQPSRPFHCSRLTIHNKHAATPRRIPFTKANRR